MDDGDYPTPESIVGSRKALEAILTALRAQLQDQGLLMFHLLFIEQCSLGDLFLGSGSRSVGRDSGERNRMGRHPELLEGAVRGRELNHRGDGVPIARENRDEVVQVISTVAPTDYYYQK